jgi:hypothetical protein
MRDDRQCQRQASRGVVRILTKYTLKGRIIERLHLEGLINGKRLVKRRFHLL